MVNIFVLRILNIDSKTIILCLFERHYEQNAELIVDKEEMKLEEKKGIWRV